MPTKLFIVESPGKLKTLRKILGRDFTLEASVGHTTELAHDGPKRLGLDFEGDQVNTRYVPRGDRGLQVLAKLRHAARGVEMVYLATDPDREGEAIAWHLVEQLGLKRYCRVSFTQLTEAAVREAIQKPGRLDIHLIEAQRTRQCLDKMVGYGVSPLLWKTTGGKSAGRVQSATLHLICEREKERLAFKPEKYWSLRSLYKEGFEAVFTSSALSSPDPDRIGTEAEAERIVSVARSSSHVVLKQEERMEPRKPPPPLITSSLQQMAGARLKLSPKRCMEIAQKLYEGIDGQGLITYMRTDAVTLSPEFVEEARTWLKKHAPEAMAKDPPKFISKPDSQGAHEAIRPTSVQFTPEQARRRLRPEEFEVYRLIWERAIASQCKQALLARTRIEIGCADTLWVAKGVTVQDPGYLRFWKNIDEEKVLPLLASGTKLGFLDVVPEAKATQPPSRFSEAKLVQLMEKEGIGRPSTYASTIAILKEREYAVLEKSLLKPTPLGMDTDQVLLRAIPDLVDVVFTADMESSLDQIAAGKLPWQRFLSRWNREYLEPALARARKELAGVPRPPTPRSTLRPRKRPAVVRKIQPHSSAP